MDKNKKNNMPEIKENEVEVKETAKSDLITFNCDLMPLGTLTLSRSKLVSYCKTEHRSYANFPATMKGENDEIESAFDLPELSEKYGKSGLKVGIVIHLADNSTGKKTSKTRKAL